MSKRHSLGQHFLTSSQIAHSIVDFAGIKKSDVVLEVGTGKGILTPYLCTQARTVISIEKDSNLYREAKKKFRGIKNLALEHGDAFEREDIDFDIFVSNLPYSESRNAIEWLVQRKFSRAVIMVQKEFAQKLFSKGGGYRKAVTVMASYCMDMEKLMDVAKNNFQPPPKVDSVVMVLKQRKTLSKDVLSAVNTLFSFRRKTIRNIARKFGILTESDKRLEELSDSEIIEFAKKIIK
ncbi:MAG TPA: 16S rRNA (adenine(1518)-N(6)/adenine(1519)-N(6))-dimethyltransferase RsmA [Candidatus Nitrosotalea sp.]|nr:16S rRNA (adenine(1518)-N(6)/adenine(1519)-N(6))-dimethyltransferase RsmA [Candidatus Nitrosotalea sp.]